MKVVHREMEYVKEGKAAECGNVADSENEISISGIFSELVVDLLS